MKRDIDNSSEIVQMLEPQTLTGNGDATLSAKIDLQGKEGGALLGVNVGACGDTLSGSLYMQLEVQESDDDSTYTAVADKDLSKSISGAVTGTFALIDASGEDQKAYKVQYQGKKRYVKVNINRTGNHATGTIIGVVGLGLQAKYSPV